MIDPRRLRSISLALFRRKGTGLPRIAEWLRTTYQRSWSGGPVWVDDYRGGLRFRADLSDEMGSRIFWFDAYSELELDLLAKTLRSGETFIDCGANVGEFTLAAAQTVGRTGRVIAIEAMEAYAAQLSEHVHCNALTQVSVLGVAVGDRDDVVELYGQDGGNPHAGLVTAFKRDGRNAPVGTARMTTIDKIVADQRLQGVAGIKLDIEGAELPALRGASDTIARFRPWLMIEVGLGTLDCAGYGPGDVLTLLAERGYSVADITEKGLVPITDARQLGDWHNLFAQPMSA